MINCVKDECGLRFVKAFYRRGLMTVYVCVFAYILGATTSCTGTLVVGWLVRLGWVVTIG